MPTTMQFDRLNKLQNNPYFAYFKKMQISESQMRERIALAEDIEDALLVLFAILPEYTDRVDDLRISLENDLLTIVSERTSVDEQLSRHLSELTNQVIGTTLKKLKPDQKIESKQENKSTVSKDNGQVDKVDYWLSQDRAIIIAETESNTVFNHSDYMVAKEKGYTKKRWLTELDDKVRDTHIILESEVIPIDDVFVVGSSLMRYPHDTLYDPSADEIINCRCVAEYF